MVVWVFDVVFEGSVCKVLGGAVCRGCCYVMVVVCDLYIVLW